jgi:hypothetical protein
MAPRFVVLTIAVVALLAAAARADDKTVDTLSRPTTLSAYNRWLAYSAWDATAGVYRLRVIRGDLAPQDVPVPPRSVPFDVSVGRAVEPDGSHQDVLVYSRCRVEAPVTRTAYGEFEPRWWKGQGCTVRVATPTGGERVIRGAGPGVLPSVSGTHLAFIRVVHARPRIVIRRFDRTRASDATFAGPATGAHDQGPVSVDVRGPRAAVVWRTTFGDGSFSRVLVADARAHRLQPVGRANGGGLTGHSIIGASWLGNGDLAWGETCWGDPSGCPHRHNYVLRSLPDTEGVTPAPAEMMAFATSDRRAWTLEGCLLPEPQPQCALVQHDPSPIAPPGL